MKLKRSEIWRIAEELGGIGVSYLTVDYSISSKDIKILSDFFGEKYDAEYLGNYYIDKEGKTYTNLLFKQIQGSAGDVIHDYSVISPKEIEIVEDVEMLYGEFELIVTDLLTKTVKRLTWEEIKKQGELPQEVPKNEWIKQLESRMGIIQEKIGNKVIWRFKK